MRINSIREKQNLNIALISSLILTNECRGTSVPFSLQFHNLPISCDRGTVVWFSRAEIVFSVRTLFRPVVVHIYLAIQWELRVVSSELKWPEPEFDHLHLVPSSRCVVIYCTLHKLSCRAQRRFYRCLHLLPVIVSINIEKDVVAYACYCCVVVWRMCRLI